MIDTQGYEAIKNNIERLSNNDVLIVGVLKSISEELSKIKDENERLKLEKAEMAELIKSYEYVKYDFESRIEAMENKFFSMI